MAGIKASDPEGVRGLFSSRIAEEARKRVLPFVGSRTLRAALRVERVNNRWFLGVPHYWAVHYHDGRGPSFPDGKFLVWYPNPKDDPRHRGNYPVRKNQILSLRDLGYSWADVMADVREGKAVVARVSPRSGGGVRGRPFFVRGLRGFFSRGGARRVRLYRSLLKGEAPELFERRVRKVRIFV